MWVESEWWRTQNIRSSENVCGMVMWRREWDEKRVINANTKHNTYVNPLSSLWTLSTYIYKSEYNLYASSKKEGEGRRRKNAVEGVVKSRVNETGIKTRERYLPPQTQSPKHLLFSHVISTRLVRRGCNWGKQCVIFVQSNFNTSE